MDSNVQTADASVAAVDIVETPQLLHLYFERQVRRNRDAIAIEFFDESLSYGELDILSNQIANLLFERGVRSGDCVGIFLNKSPRVYAAMLAILKLGAAYVPIDPKFPRGRIDAIAEDAELRVILTENPLAEILDQAGGVHVLQLDSEREDIARQPVALDQAHSDAIAPNALCYVIYTSGSTGKPKGVMIEHRNAVAFVESLDTIYHITEKDRIYHGFSTAFDASVEEIWAAFSRGGTLVVPSEDIARSPADIANFINTRRVTYFSTVPTVLAMIESDLPTVTTLILGGEACPNELVTRWAAPGRRMLNTYGPTEATVVATWAECEAGKPVTIGKPLPRYQTYVLDENGERVLPGEVGELYVGGDGVGRGYMNLTSKTEERFRPDPYTSQPDGRMYRTFDQVQLDENGDLLFLGRLDDQIKIRGFRIELSEIESVLVAFPSIKAASVCVTEISQSKELAAFIILSETDSNLDRDALAARLRKSLPPYMIPKYLDVVDDLPLMPSGKIDRKSLPKPTTLLLGTGDFVAPNNEIEEIISGIWCQVFGLPEISTEADFFLDLGGHSLTAAQSVNKLRQTLDISQVSVRDVYECRTIKVLANVLKKRRLSENGHQSVNPPANDNSFGCGPGLYPQVNAWVRATTVSLQAISAAVFYGLLASPLAIAACLIIATLDGLLSAGQAISIATAIGFAWWPSSVLLSVALKWVVIGRYKAGAYPVWSFYYLRWWVVNRFQSLAMPNLFVGTPLMSLYMRAMGAKVGRRATISTSICSIFDLVTIGDDASIGLETHILGYRVERGYLYIEPVEIGNDCFVGMHSNLGLRTRMEDGARLDDMSALLDGETIPQNEGRCGSPAQPADVVAPEELTHQTSAAKTVFYGATHFALIYAMGYFLILTSLPAVATIAYGFIAAGWLGGIVAAFCAVPIGLVSYGVGVIALRRLLGDMPIGKFPIFSKAYVKHWFMSYLLENTRSILSPLYATMYLPPFLRALGAKIGRGCEISTVAHFNPCHMEIGEGSFLADACLVGGQRVHGGVVELGAVHIGSKSFIGNSALVPCGSNIGDNTLVGVASATPKSEALSEGNKRWLGSPSFELPRTQQASCFGDEMIYKPSIAARLERAQFDLVRVMLPGMIYVATSLLFIATVVASFRYLPIWGVALTVIFVSTLLAFATIGVSAFIKNVVGGRLKPVVKPLWSRFVWSNELVNGVYENVASNAMTPLMGTPFMAPCLRLMGCKIGRDCFIETTLFSEFDLVEIGDQASLNLGSTIQTHLFEDRIFKADVLKIGDRTSVGNMAFVLYATEICDDATLEPLSLLMKGEALPQGSRWQGIPCEPTRFAISGRA